MHRLPYPSSTQYKTTFIGELVHSDVCGPMSYTSLGGARFFVIFKDDYSKWIRVHFMKNKSEVPIHFECFLALIKNESGNCIKTLRSDNGGEYESGNFSKRFVELGIRHETSAPYSPQQNGVAERENRTLMEMARSKIYSSKSKMSLWIWGEATAYAAYILNRISSSKSQVSPFEAWTGRKPDVSHLRIFGSRAVVHIPDAKRTKLEATCVEGVLTGFCESTKAYRIYITSLRKIICSRDIIIDEAVGYGGDISNP